MRPLLLLFTSKIGSSVFLFSYSLTFPLFPCLRRLGEGATLSILSRLSHTLCFFSFFFFCRTACLLSASPFSSGFFFLFQRGKKNLEEPESSLSGAYNSMEGHRKTCVQLPLKQFLRHKSSYFFKQGRARGGACLPLKVEEEDHAVKMPVREENQRNVTRNLHSSQYGAGKLVGGEVSLSLSLTGK